MLKKSTQYWLRVVLIVLAVIFLWAIIPVLWPLIVSLICTLILLPVVNNIQDYMRHRLGFTWFPRWLAIIPAFLLVALILLLVIQFIILPFIAEFTRLLNNLPVLMSQLILLWQDITSGEWLKLPPQIDAIVMTTLALNQFLWRGIGSTRYICYFFTGYDHAGMLTYIDYDLLFIEGRTANQK